MINTIFKGVKLKFTPLEFETQWQDYGGKPYHLLKFTPLEFETTKRPKELLRRALLKFTPLEFETFDKFCQDHKNYLC